MAKRTPQPGLFDDVVEPSIDEGPKGPPEWREMKQSVFLSWDRRSQLRYCSNRDLNSALWADYEGRAEDAAWYRNRASGYQEDLGQIHDV